MCVCEGERERERERENERMRVRVCVRAHTHTDTCPSVSHRRSNARPCLSLASSVCLYGLECLVYLSTDLMALKTYIVSNSTHSSGNDARFSTTYVSSFDDKRRHIHTQTEEGRRIHRHSNISEDIHAQAHRHTLGSPTTCADVDGARVSTCRPQN